MRVGRTSRSLGKRSTTDSAHLVEIATDSMLSELWRPKIYTKTLLPDIEQQTQEAELVVEYLCAMANVQRFGGDGNGIGSNYY